MKVLISPDFNQKIAAIDKNHIAALAAFISRAEDASLSDLLTSNEFVSLIQEGVYCAKLENLRVFFTAASNADDEIMVLMDVASIGSKKTLQAQEFFTSKNPRTNSVFNPRLNSSINPKLNSSINPKLNSSINPKLNSSINPRLNSAINPRLNSSLNYRLNASINPKMNSSINPRVNTSLNPRINRGYGGPYLYNIALEQIGYIVKADEKVDLLYRMDCEFDGLLVLANDKVKIAFDRDSQWIGHFVKANDDVWLRFSLDNEWGGMLI